MQLLVRHRVGTQLRQESAEFPAALYWLSALLARQGRVDEAIEALRCLSRRAGHEHGARLQILSVLREADRVDELRRLADSGDRAAGRQLNLWLVDHHDVNGLRGRAAGGDNQALWSLALLLAEAGNTDAAVSELQELVDQGHPHARKLIEKFRSEELV